MSEVAPGSGAANDPMIVTASDVDTTPDPPDEAKVAQGIADAKSVYLAEARDAVPRAEAKLARAKAEVEHAEAILAGAMAEVASLEGSV